VLRHDSRAFVVPFTGVKSRERVAGTQLDFAAFMGCARSRIFMVHHLTKGTLADYEHAWFPGMMSAAAK
jgi:hypothetical protein